MPLSREDLLRAIQGLPQDQQWEIMGMPNPETYVPGMPPQVPTPTPRPMSPEEQADQWEIEGMPNPNTYVPRR
jgi:hypothetical protein